MTEFIIKGISAVLPKDISFSLIDENAEITNNGSFTWDIELSLMNPVNAKIFKHINRLNINSIETRMDAALIVDNKVRRGSIVVLSTTDKSVSTQFLSGNSELNYIAKNEKKIWELEGPNNEGWGEEEPIAFYQASRSIEYIGYGKHQLSWNSSFQNNYVCTPVLISGKILNDWILYTLAGQTQLETVNNIVMQPYLLYYIDKLPSLLGYELGYNCLSDNESAKKMYLTNPIASLKYSDALPDITVSEFISAIEGLFNVTFKVNESTKTISIVKTIPDIQSRKVVSLEVVDEYKRDFSVDENNVYRSGLNIGYAMNNSDKYFVYQKLSDDQLKNFTIIERPSMEELVTAAQVGPTDVKKWMTIFKDTSTGNYYYINDLQSTSFDRSTGFGYRFLYKGVYAAFILINKFRDLVTDENSSKLDLKICPAAMTAISKNSYWNSNTTSTTIIYQLPKCSRSLGEVSENQNIFDVIEKGVNELPRLDFIEVAFFSGKIDVYEITDSIKPSFLYPFSHIDTYPEFYHYATNLAVWTNWLTNVYSVAATDTFRIYGTGGVFERYTQLILDTSKEYTFDFIEKQSVSANDLFSIKNKTYMPISLERTVGINGFGKVVKTKCYALK